MSEPQRIQLSRRKGWKMPADAVKVDRTTRWGNPFKPGGKVICPGRWGCAGSPYDGSLPAGKYANAAVGSSYEIRAVLDLADAVALFASMVACYPMLAGDIRAELAGKSLACWCPVRELAEPYLCHRDYLFVLANPALALPGPEGDPK